MQGQNSTEFITRRVSMNVILSRISSVIIAGGMTHANDQQLLDGIRNLTNGVVAYPKNRILQTLLDPRLAIDDSTSKVIAMCVEVSFGEMRMQIVDDLQKHGVEKDMVMLLRHCTNSLLDNDKMLHVHGSEGLHHSDDGNTNISKKSYDKIIFLSENCQNPNGTTNVNLLYKKCDEVGLPKGYLNLYPAEMLKEISISEPNIASTICRVVKSREEMQQVLNTCHADRSRMISVVELISAIGENKIDINSLLRISNSVLDVALRAVKVHEKCCSMTCARLLALQELYDKNKQMFDSIKHYPALPQFMMVHTDTNLSDKFVELLWYNERKIQNIKNTVNDISIFLHSYLLTHHHGINNAKALIDLSIADLDACKLIIHHNDIINELKLDLQLVCSVALRNRPAFDMLFGKYNDSFDLIRTICKKQKITPNRLMELLANDQDTNNLKEFLKMYDSVGYHDTSEDRTTDED